MSHDLQQDAQLRFTLNFWNSLKQHSGLKLGNENYISDLQNLHLFVYVNDKMIIRIMQIFQQKINCTERISRIIQ